MTGFGQALSAIPGRQQSDYLFRLEESLTKSTDEVATITGLRGIMFELNTLGKVTAAGLEELDFEAWRYIGKVDYRGYSKRADLSGRPDAELSSRIDCDIPVVRGGKPFAYEVKSYPRMAYGRNRQNRNQVLKYQTAIDNEQIAGAAIQIKGRLDPDFIRMAMGSEESPSPIPDVEILYTLDLPSGAEFTVPLVPVDQGEELKIGNPADHELTDMDRQVVEGLKLAQSNGTLVAIVSGQDLPKINGIPTYMTAFLRDPMTINSLDIFKKYEEIRRVAIYESLLAELSS